MNSQTSTIWPGVTEYTEVGKGSRLHPTVTHVYAKPQGYLEGGILQGWDQSMHSAITDRWERSPVLTAAALQQWRLCVGHLHRVRMILVCWDNAVFSVLMMEGSPSSSKLTQGHALQTWTTAWATAYGKLSVKIRTYASTGSTAFLLVP